MKKLHQEKCCVSVCAGFVFLFLLFGGNASAQRTDTLLKKLDSLSAKTDSAGVQVNKTAPSEYNSQTSLTPKTYLVLLTSNLKQSFTKPFHLKRRDWKYIGAFAATEIALSFADKPLQKQVLKWRRNEPLVSSIGSHITEFGGMYELYTLGALGTYGFLFRKKKMQTATLLASQAYITGAALQATIKFFHRPRAAIFGLSRLN